MSLAIHWFRRDLRLDDNPALHAASSRFDQVLPVYILSQWKQHHRWTGPLRQHFLCDALASLRQSLRDAGSDLLLLQGDATTQLEKLLHTSGASALFANRAPDPFGRATEKRLAEVTRQLGVELHLFKDAALHERDEVLTGSGSPFRVFTPYSRAWSKLPKPSPLPTPPARLQAPAQVVLSQGLPLPSLETWNLPPLSTRHSASLPEASEHAARKRLDHFLATSGPSYAASRDLPGAESTSRISQDLRFGLLSIRRVYAAVLQRMEGATLLQRQSLQTFINELCWREFYFQVLWHWPEVLEVEFSPAYRGLPWKNHPAAFERWSHGQTGFPIVDAGMRQLLETGFMHNRVRMIVAMFLTKDLHLDWRQGESWFMQHLLDGEIASNNGGWQWSAGTGTDAAPYFRIQNPWTQSERFDPDGLYIKRWIPELRDVPPVRFKGPPTPGIPLAKGYPLPMLDHSVARDAALEMYKSHLAKASR
ncbi:MAG: hypothetical protein RLZZ244_2640 [Verrucomicrobiota bacterium]|jgi:deoxyribodipyrimidine photo-lyase